MSVMVAELYDALVAAGAPEDKARAAEALSRTIGDSIATRRDLEDLKTGTRRDLKELEKDIKRG